MENSLDSYCGIYCGACDILIAGRTGARDKFVSFWSEPLVRACLKAAGNPLGKDEQVNYECRGCKSDRLFSNCAACAIRKCAMERKLAHCIDCVEYPCSEFAERKKAAGILPHWKETHSSMETIRDIGLDSWLRSQETRWKCPGCGTSFGWYSEKCPGCGRDLGGLAYRFSRLKSFILKIGILMLPFKAQKKGGKA